MTLTEAGEDSSSYESQFPTAVKLPNLPGTRPKFGHEILEHFSFQPNYLNLNHGSYGSLPNYVAQACATLAQASESNPDLFMRRTMHGLLVRVRKDLARFIGASDDEVVMVPNATHGINTVLKNFEWKENDILVGFTTTYGAVSRTLQYISDLPPHPKLHIIPLLFPISHAQIVDVFRSHIKSINRLSGQKIVAVIDSIVSNPGCVLPWEAMVEVCKEEGIWSVIDAAHSIGQVDLDMTSSDPDFLITNCHKWLYAKRGAAVLYVPKRNQHLIKSSFPTSSEYVSPSDPQIPGAPTAPNFVNQFEWTGTIDYTPYLSVTAALLFREWLGGERVINQYCHAIAMQGGRRLAEALGTHVMDETGELTANMVNVAVPFPNISLLSPAQQLRIKTLIVDKLLLEHQASVAMFVHNGQWWARCSAQVWIEVSDFERIGEVLVAIGRDLEKEIEQMRGSTTK